MPIRPSHFDLSIHSKNDDFVVNKYYSVFFTHHPKIDSHSTAVVASIYLPGIDMDYCVDNLQKMKKQQKTNCAMGWWVVQEVKWNRDPLTFATLFVYFLPHRGGIQSIILI